MRLQARRIPGEDMLRKIIAALALVTMTAMPAQATLEPSLIGTWTTEQSDGSQAHTIEMTLRPENGDGDITSGPVDGVWNAPGFDGVMFGQIGSNTLTGEWVLGARRGTFTFTLDPANRCRFTGSWTENGGGGGSWNGTKQRCRP